MYKRMLIPLDGSDIAEVVFPYAIEIAGRLGLEMTVLHVCSQHESESIAVYRAYVEHAAEHIIGQVRDIQKEVETQPQDQLAQAEGEVTIGHPAEEILRFADISEADLLLMATHGRSGIKRWAMGSVADKVLRSSTIPVWLVRAADSGETTDNKRPVKKIIVTLDGSAMAESVLSYVEMLAKQWGDGIVDVVLLTVCEPMVLPSFATAEAPVNWENIVEEHLTYSNIIADKYLAGIAMRLKNAGFKVSTEIIEGTPADGIVNYANENPCSLIAMATHGHSGISRWAYGSVAEKVISGASCPVFLVRPPLAEGIPLLQDFIGTVRSLPPF